jgi:hypothetical protein
MVSRREFVKIVVVSPHLYGSGVLMLLSDPAEAFFPLITQFIVGGFVRTTVTRAVVTQGVRSAPLVASSLARGQGARAVTATGVREYGKKAAIKGSVATQFGLSAGFSISVSPNVLAKAQEFSAEAIWMRTDVQNSFVLEVRNESDQVLVEKLAILLKNVEKNAITNQLFSGVCKAQPNSVFRKSFMVSELPYKGIVRLSAQSTASELSASPSGNIVVAERDEIEFGN